MDNDFQGKIFYVFSRNRSYLQLKNKNSLKSKDDFGQKFKSS
tara:strand:- start:1101 stop:1226 length:126 start_codon:yes stop_codon:yes gene_type:complete